MHVTTGKLEFLPYQLNVFFYKKTFVDIGVLLVFLSVNPSCFILAGNVSRHLFLYFTNCFYLFLHVLSPSVLSDSLPPYGPQPMGFSRQEFWSGQPFPSPWDLPDPGIEPRSLALKVGSLPSEPPVKPIILSLISSSFTSSLSFLSYWLLLVSHYINWWRENRKVCMALFLSSALLQNSCFLFIAGIFPLAESASCHLCHHC